MPLQKELIRKEADNAEEKSLTTSGVPSELIPEFRQIFDALDSDKNGRVTTQDLADALGVTVDLTNAFVSLLSHILSPF